MILQIIKYQELTPSESYQHEKTDKKLTYQQAKLRMNKIHINAEYMKFEIELNKSNNPFNIFCDRYNKMDCS